MKRLITFICLILIVFIGYRLIAKGLENDVFNIASYKTIETKSEALTKKLAIYDKKNQDEYDMAITKLNSSEKAYQDSKAKYDAIVEELADVLDKGQEEQSNEVIEEVIYSDKEKYKVDFLLVTMGDYGEKEGVDVVYQLTTSSTTDPNSTSLNYFLADLKFVVTGQYMDVANFISDLENDDKLGWEIKEFTMENGTANGYSGVSATFTIKDVPIDSESYLASDASESTSDGEMQSNTTEENNSVSNTDSSTTNTATAENTTNNLTNTVSNTTNNSSNTVSNNTIN